MNTLQAIRRSRGRGRASFFECKDLGEAIEIAIEIKSLAYSVVGTFNGITGVFAIPKAEVM